MDGILGTSCPRTATADRTIGAGDRSAASGPDERSGWHHFRVTGAVGPSEIFVVVVAVVMLGGIARLVLRKRRAAPIWSAITNDPVTSEFRGVRVQINPGDAIRQATLRSGGLDQRVVVRTHSLQIGRWYSFHADDITMETGRVRYGWHEHNCMILSGTYGGDPIRPLLPPSLEVRHQPKRPG
jgi:hypothetical protein